MDRVPYISIVYAWFLIFVPRFVMSKEMAKQDGGYNNNDPRTQQAKLEGRGKRATNAHLNGFEALPAFAIAVLAAIQRGASINVVAAVSITFCVMRTVYVWAYLEDKAGLRSPMWAMGMFSTLGLMTLAIIGS